jgi:two-component system sensor histidine kinase BaeS
VTGERNGPLGALGTRLLAAFVLVAVFSVAALTLAALVGTDRGLRAAQQSDRAATAAMVARAAGAAYAVAGGWPGADLREATALASAAGAHLSVLDNRTLAI